MEYSKARAEVLEYGVRVENLFDKFLICYLRLNDNTDSFGNSHKRLTLFNKINLLSDLSLLSDDGKKRLDLFSRIRNIFAHRHDILDFTNCFNEIDSSRFGKSIQLYFEKDKDAVKKLLKRPDLEDNYRFAFRLLIHRIIGELGKMLNKSVNQSDEERSLEYADEYLEKCSQFLKIVDVFQQELHKDWRAFLSR